MTDAEVAVINFLTADIGRAHHLHLIHTADQRGHCVACRTQMAPTLWPCIIRRLADDAIRCHIPRQRTRPQ